MADEHWRQFGLIPLGLSYELVLEHHMIHCRSFNVFFAIFVDFLDCITKLVDGNWMFIYCMPVLSGRFGVFV